MTVAGFLSLVKNSTNAKPIDVPKTQFTQTGTRERTGEVTISQSADTLIPIPEGTLGWAILINRDATARIDLKTASSGTIFAALQPNGGFIILYFGSGVTAPYGRASVATTAPVEFKILEA